MRGYELPSCLCGHQRVNSAPSLATSARNLITVYEYFTNEKDALTLLYVGLIRQSDTQS